MDGVAAPPHGLTAPPAAEDPAALPRLRRRAAVLWLAVAVPVNALIFLGRQLWGSDQRPLIDDAFMHWDGRWFMTIARDGYSYTPGQQSNVAFAPAFPIVSKGVSWVVGSLPLAMVLTAATFGLVGFLLVATWFGRRESVATSRSVLLLFALYPFTVYLTGIPYSEPLYLATAVWAFLALESDRPLLAGLLGLVTTATRVTGVALAAGLVVMAVARCGAVRAATAEDRTAGPADGWRWGRVVVAPGRLRLRDAWVLLSWVGIGLWMAHFQDKFGDPVLFSNGNFGAPGRWLTEPSIRTLFKVQYFENLTTEIPAYVITTTVHGILAVLAIALMPAVVRRYGVAYGVFCGVIIVMSWMTSGAFQSFGRYLLVAFPLFGPVALWADRTPLRMVWLPRFFAVGLFGATLMWANGHWLS